MSSNGAAPTGRGTVIVHAGSLLTMEDCTFENNRVNHQGGAIYASSSVLNISNTSFDGNEADEQGGALFLMLSAAQEPSTYATFDNCEFKNNSSRAGGVMSCYANNAKTSGVIEVTANDCEIIDNQATTGEGGVFRVVNIKNGNGSQQEYTYDVILNLNDCTVRGNSAKQGGVVTVIGEGSYDITNTAAHINIADCEISENKATNGHGGVVYDGNRDSTFIDVSGATVMSGNTPDKRDGGVFWVSDYEHLTVGENAEFTGNSARTGAVIKAEDIPLHDTQVLTKSFTSPYQYGYNNYDINYEGLITYVVEYYQKSLADSNLIGGPVLGSTTFDLGEQITEEIIAGDLGADWIDAYRPEWFRAGTVVTQLPLTVDEMEMKVIKVLYESMPTYVVRYLDETTNTVLHEEKVAPAEVGDSVNALNEKIEIGGYEYVRAVPESLIITENSDDNVLTLYYSLKASAQIYTVHYLDEATGAVIREVKTSAAEIGAVIHALDEKVEIQGFEYKRAEPESLVIAAAAEQNVLTLYYSKKVDTIKEPVDHGNGGNSGGDGGGGGSSTRPATIVSNQTPTGSMAPTEIPLAELPGSEVPLAAVSVTPEMGKNLPKTGDDTNGWMWLVFISGVSLVAGSLVRKNRKES